MNPFLEKLQLGTRRHFLQQSAAGIGGIALNSLLAGDGIAGADPLISKQPHFPGKAKRVIYLHMTGSPPNLDMFDYKPQLIKHDDQDCPDEFIKGKEFAFTSGVPKLMGSPREWKQVGQNGMWMSDAVPHFHGIADDMCMVHSMHSDQFNHAPAELLTYTGSPRSGRPSMGS
ncbi:DUF1501 domain-containing protein, partial [Verrucomicrobiales bacterium]|nr:DUF1501 domain-containing protein [Verrucomicrobiales bacterium]